MFGAFGRLFAITCAAIFLTSAAVITIRWMASHQEFEAPPHAWMNDATWTLREPPAAELCGPPKRGSNEQIWVLHVRRANNTWTSDCAAPLKDTLNALGDRRILLKVESRDSPSLESWLDELVQTADGTKASIAIWAPAQKISRYLRKQAPQWLFAADSGALLRLHLFTSLWLEPAMDFWPDFVIASPAPKGDQRLSAREVEEIHRRRKRVVWMENSDAPFRVDGRFIK